jgi:hypothetical protein
MEANLNDVFLPVEIDTRNMRLGPQRPLDRIRAFWAVDIVQLKYRVLLARDRWMSHDFGLLRF